MTKSPISYRQPQPLSQLHVHCCPLGQLPEKLVLPQETWHELSTRVGRRVYSLLAEADVTTRADSFIDPLSPATALAVIPNKQPHRHMITRIVFMRLS